MWDIDSAAVEVARASVSAELDRLGSSHVDVDARVIDTFAQIPSAKFQLVLTNPPWDQLKPDSRDGVQAATEYKAEIRSYAAQIAGRFPEAATCRRRSIGGYTANLARAGALAAASFVQQNGMLAIILPSTIFGDQVSGAFRQRFFEELAVEEIEYFPASTRAFSGVDQAFVTIRAVKAGATDQVRLSRMRADFSIGDVRNLANPRSGAALALEVSAEAQELTDILQGEHPPLSWLENNPSFGLKLGREVDETRISEAFGERGMPFVRGRDMARYRFAPGHLPRLDTAKRRLPATVHRSRVVWRDISNPAQKRRVHSAIIPPDHVTGNSLGVAIFSAACDECLRVLMAVFNSFAFEIQVRGRLATNHISQGALRHCAVPSGLFADAELRARIAGMATKASECLHSERMLEVSIARAFGLSRDAFASLLGCFEKVNADEADAMLTRELWA